MSIKFLVVLGRGGGTLGFLGGGECRFDFYGRGDFSDRCPPCKRNLQGHLWSSFIGFPLGDI